MSVILALDTSRKFVRVGFLKNGEIHAQTLECPQKQSEALQNLLGELLSERRVDISEITEIRLSAGPGSFTGLRVSYAFAKGLAYARGISVRTFAVPTEDEVLTQLLHASAEVGSVQSVEELASLVPEYGATTQFKTLEERGKRIDNHGG